MGVKQAIYVCSFEGCGRAIGRSRAGRWLCKAHEHQRLRGRELRPLKTPLPASERFWMKVDKNGPVHPVLGTRCWLWLAGRRGHMGYGSFRLSTSSKIGAHRFAWAEANGPIPEGLDVLHHCDNPPCVNHEHMYLGTDAENVADREARGRGGDHHGEMNGRNAKLKSHEVLEIRRLYTAGGIAQAKLGQRFGVTEPVIWKIIHRTAWSHI